MASAGDPSTTKNGYVVPLPRVTDALGKTLRRIFVPLAGPADFADVIRRLDAIR